MSENVIFDTVEIEKILPHRFPFLMVDKVIEFEENKRIVAVKNVSANEPFFSGHFPGRPIMPGVLIVETMAQAGAILASRSSQGLSGPDTMMILVGVEGVRFKKPVVPGDTLRIEMLFVKKKGPIFIMEGTVTVQEKVVASGSIMAAESAR